MPKLGSPRIPGHISRLVVGFSLAVILRHPNLQDLREEDVVTPPHVLLERGWVPLLSGTISCKAMAGPCDCPFPWAVKCLRAGILHPSSASRTSLPPQGSFVCSYLVSRCLGWSPLEKRKGHIWEIQIPF